MHRTRVHVIAGVFWFMAIAFGWELALSMVDLPHVIGPLLGAAVGLVVALDPMRVIWPAAANINAASPAVTSTGVQPLAGGRVVAPGTAALGTTATDRAPVADAAHTARIDL
jgi:hypothetical protein